MFNEINDIKIEYKYCGAFASTKDNLGFIGKDPNKDIMVCIRIWSKWNIICYFRGINAT